MVAVDTETTSLDETRAELVGISLCIEPGRACYIPLGHINPEKAEDESLPILSHSHATSDPREDPEQIPLKTALNALRPLLADPGVLKVGHNIKYDMVVFGNYGLYGELNRRHHAALLCARRRQPWTWDG